MITTTKDPVCGMDVTPAGTAVQTEYQAQTDHFCCPACKKSFDKDPERYLKQGAQAHQH